MSLVDQSVKTIDVPGILDHRAAEEFEQLVREAIATNPKTLHLNCQALERVVSSHITLLWTARELCHRVGIAMELTEPPDALIRILNVLDLADIFEYDRPLNERAPQTAPVEMPLAEPELFQMRPCATGDSIDHIIIQFLVFLNRLHVDPPTALELQTLLYEVTTNVRLHSGLGSEDTFIIEAVADARQLMLTVTDSGRPFDPTANRTGLDPKSASRLGQRRGFGIPMIHRLADEVVYQRNDHGYNVLRLTKKWR